ncbi:hypothetical protein AK812_SmicGene12886 [Symbiodinium microadriaticum]|uniref:Uncharacterized protein n=1 Tax=Symbiodinium microadriaticum TaxID=2951 RepID=A0A1Q9E9K8_SYMMI|nr:hypothetical protein AK812_SmicGene12886 [Symbiodinium microadriaticum]
MRAQTYWFVAVCRQSKRNEWNPMIHHQRQRHLGDAWCVSDISLQIRFNIDIEVQTEFDIGTSQSHVVSPLCRFRGSQPPHLKNIVATHTGRGMQEGVELLVSWQNPAAHLDMASAEDFHFTLSISGRVSGLPINTSVGLAKFSLSGNACVLLSPLIDAVPIFAGGKMYFLDLPDLHFEFFGMRSAPASALSLSMHAGKLLGPILVQAVQNCAEKVLQSFVVPGGIYVPISPIPPSNLMPPPVTKQAVDQQDVSDVDLGDRRDLLGQFSGTVQTIHEMVEGKDWLGMVLTPDAAKAMPDPSKPLGGVLSLAVLGSCAGVVAFDSIVTSTSTRIRSVLVPVREFLEVAKLTSDVGIVDSIPAGPEHEKGGPRKLSVDYTRLMGLEAPDEFVEEVMYSTASVTVDAGKPPKNFNKGGLWKKGLETLWSSPSGGTLKHPPMKTKKARAWGASQTNPKGRNEEKKMPYGEIAKIAGLPEGQVKLLVEMQRSLQVVGAPHISVWYQAFHRLLEYPGGVVSVEVSKEDKTSLGKVSVDLQEVEEQEDNILQAASDRRILSRHGAVVLKLHPWLCLVLKPGLQVRLPLEGPGTRGTDSSLRLSDAAPPLRAAHRRSLTGRDVVLVFEIELQGCPPQSRVFSMRSRLLMRLRRSKLERRKGHANFVIRPDLVHGIVD